MTFSCCCCCLSSFRTRSSRAPSSKPVLSSQTRSSFRGTILHGGCGSETSSVDKILYCFGTASCTAISFVPRSFPSFPEVKRPLRVMFSVRGCRPSKSENERFHFGSLARPRGYLGYPGPGAGGTKGNPSTLPVLSRSFWKCFFNFIYEIFAQDALRRTSGNEGNFPGFPRFPEVEGVNVALGPYRTD